MRYKLFNSVFKSFIIIEYLDFGYQVHFDFFVIILILTSQSIIIFLLYNQLQVLAILSFKVCLILSLTF